MNYAILIVVVGLLALWALWGLYVNTTTARPEYEVVQGLSSDVEVREYPPLLVAESRQNSFGQLFNYISGANAEQKKIAMTSPVINEGNTMSFILPGDDGPEPTGQVELRTIPARKVAVVRFGGYVTQAGYEQRLAELRQTLAENSIGTEGSPFLMQYNDPWTPPFMRRNEIGLVVST
jgi:hypothetical protein